MYNEFQAKGIQISRNSNRFSFQIIIQLLTLRVGDCQMLTKLDVMDNYNIFLF